MMATFQLDVQLPACYKNNMSGTGQCNNVHSTHVAHQTVNWCFDYLAFKNVFFWVKHSRRPDGLSPVGIRHVGLRPVGTAKYRFIQMVFVQ